MNELEGGNPSKLLVAAIRKHGIEEKGSFREDDFYLGAFQGKRVSTNLLFFREDANFDQLSQVYHILSGDPSRGAIALESHAAPIEGTTVQVFSTLFGILLSLIRAKKLYHRSKSMSAEVPARYMQPLLNQRTMAFIASSSDVPAGITQSHDGVDEAVRLLPDTFLASSENGFSLSRSQGGVSEGAWKCTVPGALTALEWS